MRFLLYFIGMIKKLFYGILFVLFVSSLSFAQKTVIKSFCKNAESFGVKATERDLQELEKRFILLRKDPSPTSLQRVSVLLKNRVEPGPQRDELESLFSSGKYLQAQAKVHMWLTGEDLFNPPAPVKPKTRREEFASCFLGFDLSKGAELQKAVSFLHAGWQTRLLNVKEYRNIIWSLSRMDFRNAEYILTRNDKAVLHHTIPLPQYERAQLQLAKMYEWEDLNPRPMEIPPLDNVSRREAVRQVLGPLSGGKKKPLSVHQAYYEQLPPWRQQELDAQIDQMEKIIAQRALQASSSNKGHMDKRRFSLALASFVTGKVNSSWTVMQVLYSPYVSASARLAAEKALSSNLSYWEGVKAGEYLYEDYSKNLEKNLVVSPEMQRVQELFQELDNYLSKNRQWPQEGVDLFPRLQELETAPGLEGAKLMIKRLKQQQQKLPEKEIYISLQNYIAQHGKLPPSTSSLYHAIMRYKKIPGPYRESFRKLFEKYHYKK